MKFDIAEFYHSLPTHSISCQNRPAATDTSHEDTRACLCTALTGWVISGYLAYSSYTGYHGNKCLSSLKVNCQILRIVPEFSGYGLASEFVFLLFTFVDELREKN